jgi:quercetin dioxygenase-like cupin family protein
MHQKSDRNVINNSEILDLCKITDYQPGAIVSRVLLNKDAGNITIFAFDEGQGLSEHTAPFDAFVQVIEGEANIKIGGVDNVLKAGEMIIMPANVSHSVFALKKFKMLLVMIKSS